MYHIVYTKQAVRDIRNLKAARLDEKAKMLIDIVKEDPLKNPPPVESLVGNLSGFYSRRINIQHRLVYQIIDEPIFVNEIFYDGTVKVLRMWTHYDKV